jgi:hypothetical protein
MKRTFIRVGGLTTKITSKQYPEIDRECRFKFNNFVMKSKPKKVDIVLDLTTVAHHRCFKQNLLFETRIAPDRIIKEPLQSRAGQVLSNNLSKEESRYFGFDLDWRIAKVASKFLIEGRIAGKSGPPRFQLLINKYLNRGKVYIIDSHNQWKITDIIYGFLQVLTIYYLCKYKKGLLFHASGVERDGEGYIFAGLSGAGKSTTSRIWNRFNKVRVFNDDRIIVRKHGSIFLMYPTPWHGDYCEYPLHYKDQAQVKKIFYIYHRKRNFAEKISSVEAFSYFCKTIFMPFWDKKCMNFISECLLDMISRVPTYKLGFKNDARVVSYIKKLK